jgi:hypothetical protein
MKSTVFLILMPCGSGRVRHLGRTYRLHFQIRRLREARSFAEVGVVLSLM